MPEPTADSYRSLDDGEEVEIREKGSRFVGQAFRAGDERTADERLADRRKRHHAATHHCSARRVGPPESVAEGSDDDGEPSGTAGPPMLAVLQGAEIHDVLVVVTRWFGGTKLGKGGLIRAYSDATREAIAAAPRRTVWREALVTMECPWSDVGAIEAVLGREAARLRACERDFAAEPRFVATVLVSDAERIRAAVVEATAGRARASVARAAPTP